MQDDAFRAFLQPRLTRGSVGSYLSSIRRVERELGVSVDGVNLSEPAIGLLLVRLAAGGMTAKKVGDCGSALRAYARFRGT